MAPTNMKTVVLGGGNSAGYLAKEMVNLKGKNPNLTIISKEKVLPYERPTLSKGYLKPSGGPSVGDFNTSVGAGQQSQDRQWYKDNGVELMLGCQVDAVDLKNKKLQTSDASEILFEKLVIATGQRPLTLHDINVKGADLDGIKYLRDLGDADGLLESLEEVKSKKGQVTVIGGSYIGMETAAMICQHGVQTNLVCAGPHLMYNLFSPYIAQFYENEFLKRGVKLIKNVMATEVVGDKRVQAVIMEDGYDQESDLVLVGVGSRPNVDMFKGQVEMANQGIKVDPYFQTSHPDVYAIGDVATFPLKFAGGQLSRQEHVQHARDSAAHAARAMVQGTEGLDEYDYLPYFYSRIFDASWVFYGLNEGEPSHFGDIMAGRFAVVWTADGVVRGVLLEGADEEAKQAAKECVMRRGALDDALKSKLNMKELVGV